MVLMLVILYMFSTYAIKLHFTAAQRRSVELKMVELVPDWVIGYAVVSTIKLFLSVVMANGILI